MDDIQKIQYENEMTQYDLRGLIRYSMKNSMKCGYPEKFKIYLIEMNEILMKRMLSLDGIECGDNHKMRFARKKEIKKIQKMHKIIDKLLVNVNHQS